MLGTRVSDSQLDLRVPRPLPSIGCDRARVREIFSNLLSNATKYHDKTPAWAEVGYIGAYETAGPGPRPGRAPHATAVDTIFYVADNGIGIDERHQEKVFEIFKRLHPQDAFGGGSGVGLTIARKMVEQHQGRLWLESQPGVGSTFYFTLPAGPAAAAKNAG